MARPPRLAEFDYLGQIAVFFTIVTTQRHTAFARDDVAAYVSAQLLRIAPMFDVEITAYCFMPDHVHILATGLTERAETLTAVVRWKQKVGYWHAQTLGRRLWQPGYWERVMRDEDNIEQAVAYAVANPLRARLVESITDYNWIGSSRYRLEELVDVCHDAKKPRWW